MKAFVVLFSPLISLLLSSAAVCKEADAALFHSPSSDKEMQHVNEEAKQAQQNENAVLTRIMPVLNKAGKAGRIYYQSSCHRFYLSGGGFGTVFSFPHLDMQSPSGHLTDLAAIQEIFRNEKSVRVSEDVSGIISIRIGHVQDRILQTRISLLKFDFDAQYNSNLAILSIDGADEVQTARLNLGIDPNSNLPGSWLSTTPGDEKMPHLSPSIKNVTIDEALNTVVKTFKSLALYGSCENENQYQINDGGIIAINQPPYE